MRWFGWFRKAPARRYRSGGISRVSSRQNAFKREIATLQKETDGSLTAAGELVRNGQATLLRRLIQPWQIRSFGYYDMLGEIKYAAQFYSRSLANLRLYAAEIDDNGDIVETDDEDAKAALDRIKDPGGGGRSGLLAAYGRLMFLTGEAYLFVTDDPDTELEQWEMLSTDELRLNDGLYTRFKAPSLPATQFSPAPDNQFVPINVDLDADGNPIRDSSHPSGYQLNNQAVAYRLWKRHPRFSDLADATMEGVLDLCEELVLLTQAVRARARSRLSGSGVLFLDDRITTTPLEPVPDEDPLEDPFIADLTEAMSTAITDEGTASAVVPLIARVRVPDGMKLSDLVYHLQIVDPTQLYPETGLRMECIQRIAIGLDMPSDILLGLTDANHWSAWMVDEQSWKAHLQPVAQQLVEDLTSSYYQPYLREQGVDGWSTFVIAYDASEIINHPDRTKDAKDLFDKRAISKKALREAAGFDEDDAMPEDERAEAIGILTHDSSLAWYAIPRVGQGVLEPDPGRIDSGSDTPEGASTGAEVEKGPPPGDAATAPEGETVIGSAIQIAQIEGGSQFALLRAREAAGARIRTAAAKEGGDVSRLVDGIPNRDVAHALGAQQVRLLIGGAKERDLFKAARDNILAALRVCNVKDDDVAVQIAEAIERHALRTLYDLNAQLPPTFTDYVRGLLTASKGP